jgi:hypothetical protein
MPNCTEQSIQFPALKRRSIEANFQGGAISSDGGVMLLRSVDRRLGLSQAVASAVRDRRRQASCQHNVLNLVQQRLYGLALGYEDLNDHQHLRSDMALQTALDRETILASSATLCRFENRADRETAWRIHAVMVDQFVSSFKRSPRKLILDFDATDDRVHGDQEGRFFHGYYDHYCFLPLYVFCQDQLLVSYLRPSKIDGAKHAWAILSLLVKRLRQAWPKVKIIFRGDAGFCRCKMLSWCERHHIGYIVGIAKNTRLNKQIRSLMEQAEQSQQELGHKVRWFTEFSYGARSWDHPRRVIAKIEVTTLGRNPRYVVTNLDGDPKRLYERLYCARGEMENKIKQQQMDLFADRTSCHHWWANQFRLLMSSLAYILIDSIRRLALQDTELARAYVGTIRLRLLKIGAIILRNTRRIRFLLSSTYPYPQLFQTVAHRLDTG